jgi:N-acyl-D-aspartate/D-glutamate deacylase
MASDNVVLIRGGRVVDGTGNPWFYGDVVLSGDRIADIAPPGSVSRERVTEVVDASGMVVCPGFIDIQSHSIIPLMIDGRCLSKVTQGVTTEVIGESWTPAPAGGRVTIQPIGDSRFVDSVRQWENRWKRWHRFRDWLEAMTSRGVSPNIGSFLGGGTLRQYARGMDMCRSSSGELDTMRRVMAEAMEDGAFGVSYALIYPPDSFTDTDELVDVCKVVSRYGGIYITHMRSEADHIFEALDETLEIGRRADLPVEIYHLKAAGRTNWDKMPQVLARINAARASGQDVTASMYPYVGSGTGLSSILPPWAAAGGTFFEKLRDPGPRAKIRTEVLNPSGNWEALGQDVVPEDLLPGGVREAGEPAVRRQAPLGDRGNAGTGLGGCRHRPVDRRRAAHLHHLLRYE